MCSPQGSVPYMDLYHFGRPAPFAVLTLLGVSGFIDRPSLVTGASRWGSHTSAWNVRELKRPFREGWSTGFRRLFVIINTSDVRSV